MCCNRIAAAILVAFHVETITALQYHADPARRTIATYSPLIKVVIYIINEKNMFIQQAEKCVQI